MRSSLPYFALALYSAPLLSSTLFDDLETVRKIDEEHQDSLPLFYNFQMMGGYFNMPSARMNEGGEAAIGAARVHPYDVYGINFQYFDHIETSVNYRVYTGITEGNFGSEGFGDDAERIGNVKIAINLPGDGFPYLPTFAYGADDFIGTKRFNSRYAVMTKSFLKENLELSFGWGWKRLRGPFGGLAWSPLRHSGTPVLKDLSLLAEYDAIDYKHTPSEHPKGRDVKSRINVGLSYVLGNTLQLSLGSVRGGHLGASGSLRYPLGSSSGFLKKVEEPAPYRTPIDLEPLGVARSESVFIHELAFQLGAQGLDLYRAYLGEGEELWLKVINNDYREESEVRMRLERVLSALTPSSIKSVVVSVEADGLLCHSYRFQTADLYRFRERAISAFEMETLSPLGEAMPKPQGAENFFLKHKSIWTLTFRPRLLTFFGSAAGKFKYNLGLVFNPEGYISDRVYYGVQVAYEVKSSASKLSSTDRLNPSQLPNVRTDTLKYFQTGSFSLEMAYLQKSWNLGRGCFARVAGGYFEPAYGGEAVEFLYYPVGSPFAIGLEEATVLKRRYEGVAFAGKIRQLKGFTPHYHPYVGVQAFLNLYATLKPFNTDLKVKVGQFLARDRGARFEMTKWFRSGLNVTLWYTVTNGHDHVNGHTYYDKGFAFGIPLDFFLQKTSRTYINYGMSAWLRDVGAIGSTGKPLYNTLRLERMQHD